MSLSNSCKFTGTLGADPEFKPTNNNKSSCKFSLAVNKKGQNGEKVTTWINCTAYGAVADRIMKYCQKGTNVTVESEYSSWKYNENWYHGFTCFQVDFHRNWKQADQNQQQGQQQNNQQQQPPQQNNQQQHAVSQQQTNAGQFDEDIPF